MCYAYISDTKSKKAEKLHFIGYSLQTKGYRLLDERKSKFLVRRDVIFDEADFKYSSDPIEASNEGPTNSQEHVVMPD